MNKCRQIFHSYHERSPYFLLLLILFLHTVLLQLFTISWINRFVRCLLSPCESCHHTRIYYIILLFAHCCLPPSVCHWAMCSVLTRTTQINHYFWYAPLSTHLRLYEAPLLCVRYTPNYYGMCMSIVRVWKWITAETRINGRIIWSIILFMYETTISDKLTSVQSDKCCCLASWDIFIACSDHVHFADCVCSVHKRRVRYPLSLVCHFVCQLTATSKWIQKKKDKKRTATYCVQKMFQHNVLTVKKFVTKWTDAAVR